MISTPSSTCSLILLLHLIWLQSSYTCAAFSFSSNHPRNRSKLKSSSFPTTATSQVKQYSSSPSSFVFPITNNDDDDEDEDDCSIPKYGLVPGEGDDATTKLVFLISDNTGTLAKNALQASLAQFESCDDRYQWDDNDDVVVLDKDGNVVNEYSNDKDENDKNSNKAVPKRCDVKTRMFTFIRSEEALASIIKVAKDKKAMIVFTLVDVDLREKALRMCELSNVKVVDLLGPTLLTMSNFLGKRPAGLPQSKFFKDRNNQQATRRVALSDSYYKRIEAVEFTLKADDGQSPWLLEEAEVIIVGVSRTGKTPLSVVLSQTQGLKVANIPLVLECPPPKELIDNPKINPKRVFCLSISPASLRQIRTTRLERRIVNVDMDDKYSLVDENSRAKSNYADRAYIMKDLKNVRDLAIKYDWTQIDVTGRAVEETASYICELLKERFEEDVL